VVDPLDDAYPPQWYRTLVSKRFGDNERLTRLLWNGLKPSTRRGYYTSVVSYTTWCEYNSRDPWPASLSNLIHWSIGRLYGDPVLPRQAQISAATLNSYLAALRSIHTDLDLNEQPFDSPCLRRVIQGANNFFPAEPRPQRTPITRSLLIRLISPEATAAEPHLDTLAVNAAFTLAFAAFLRMGEFTFPVSALSDRRRLQHEHLTVPRVKVATDHMVLVLPRSKTDKFNHGITIRVARVGDEACASIHMRRWLAARPRSNWPPLQTPLFEFTNSVPFTRDKVIAILRQRLTNVGEPPVTFAGHSFRRGAAQHALESGLSEDEIQELGRWKSEAVKRYYKRTPQAIVDLNQRFQTGRPLPATVRFAV